MGVVSKWEFMSEKPLKLKFIYAKITHISIIFSLPQHQRRRRVRKTGARQRTKNANTSNAFFRMEFTLGHDDIYQNFYWYLLLSDGFQMNAFKEEEMEVLYTLWYFTSDFHFPIQQTFHCGSCIRHSLISNCFYRQ